MWLETLNGFISLPEENLQYNSQSTKTAGGQMKVGVVDEKMLIMK